jgi:hypothetical protein
MRDTNQNHTDSDTLQSEEEARAALELERRVIYSMMVPGVRLARAFGVPLKEVGEWVELGYLKELLDGGFKLKNAAELLKVSVRKVSMLSSRLRENFFLPELEHELPARIEFMLWAEPLSRKRIKQYLSSSNEDAVDDAIDLLVEQGRIREVDGRTTTFEVVTNEQRLVRDDLMARIDALNTLLGNVTDAVFGRFFQKDEKAFARSLQFRVRAEDLPRLKALYEEHVWRELSALDEAARQDPNAISMGATLCWAPMDLTIETIEAAEAREEDATETTH